MAQNNLAVIGAGGFKSLVSLGDLDTWMDMQVNARFGGGGDVSQYYKAVPWLFRGTMLRAQAMASFPFDVVKDGSTTPIDPEEYATELDFISDLTTKLWLIEASLTLTGKAYLRTPRNRARYVKDVRYYAPTTITPKYDKTSGDLIGYTRKANSKTYELTPEEITAFWYPDPFAEIGEPLHYPAQAARAASGSLFNLDLFIESFFGRGAIKVSVLSVPANTQKSERDRLKDWWRTVANGVLGAFGVEVMNADAVNVTTIGEGVKELENTALSQEKREDIAAALTIPQTMLFSGSAAGLGGGGVTDADDIRFVNEFKIPEFEFIAKILNRGVMLPNGYRIIPQPDRLDALHEDEAALASTATSYADLIDKCADYETWEALADMTGFEYDEAKIKKVFALKESRRVEQANAEQARLEAQRQQMGQGGYEVRKPEVPQLTAGENAKGVRWMNVGETSNFLGSMTNTVLTPELIQDANPALSDNEAVRVAKNLEIRQYNRWAAKASNAGKVFKFAYLTEDEQQELTGVKKKNVKSVDAVSRQFCARWKERIKRAFQDDTANLDPDLREILEYHVTSAYTEGLIEAGVDPQDFTDEDTQAADTLYLEQTEHLGGFVEAVLEAVENVDAREGVLARAELWCNSIQQIGDNARNGATDGMFEFVLVGEPSDESCETCSKLLGKKHRWSWVVKNGYEVKAGNDNFECGCFNCPHGWEPVKKGDR